ncbi:hypothetical protein ANN_09192 [Periplaneta americana]|uniref:HTH psq-type domain-containing protein n=1 Tax=Periplaneta americana TaxID=6978 RepID=A0ABQ8TKP0_PERAM|nr:hypothetical protein ANN_09192 [Periplaneta americana]
MAGSCKGGNEPPGSLKASNYKCHEGKQKKEKGLKWDSKAMEKRIKSVISGDISLKEASALYHLPLSTLYDRVNKEKEKQAGLTPRVTEKIEHPTVLSGDMEKALVDRLLYLANRELGLTPLAD